MQSSLLNHKTNVSIISLVELPLHNKVNMYLKVQNNMKQENDRQLKEISLERSHNSLDQPSASRRWLRVA